MNKYYDNLNEEIKEYFKILEPDFPEWLMNILTQKNCYHKNTSVLLVVLYILNYLKAIFSFQV